MKLMEIYHSIINEEFQFPTESTNDIISYLRTKINAPYIGCRTSELGGHNMLFISVSMEPKDAWVNSIFENSNHSKFSISQDGRMRQISGYGMGKFRQTNVKNINDVITKINQFISQSK